MAIPWLYPETPDLSNDYYVVQRVPELILAENGSLIYLDHQARVLKARRVADLCTAGDTDTATPND